MSYGSDGYALDAWTPGRYASGARAVGQALYRRLITPRGTLRGGEEELRYGLDLTEYLGAIGYDMAAVALPSLVRNELLKDDRVVAVDVDAAIADDGTSITLEITATLTDDASLALTVAVSDADAELIGGIRT